MLQRRAMFAFGVFFIATGPATPAVAWDGPAGSPPGWQPQWVQTRQRVALFATATTDFALGEVPPNTYLRVDAPAQKDRLWVYNPLNDGWAWLPRLSAGPVDEPLLDDVLASAGEDSPREYLYARAPELAPRLDCIIAGESGWDPTQRNPRSGAAGLAQFLPTTWAITPQGQLGQSPYDPLVSIDAAIWLARTHGWSQWQVYTAGRCHV